MEPRCRSPVGEGAKRVLAGIPGSLSPDLGGLAVLVPVLVELCRLGMSDFPTCNRLSHEVQTQPESARLERDDLIWFDVSLAKKLTVMDRTRMF